MSHMVVTGAVMLIGGWGPLNSCLRHIRPTSRPIVRCPHLHTVQLHGAGAQQACFICWLFNPVCGIHFHNTEAQGESINVWRDANAPRERQKPTSRVFTVIARACIVDVVRLALTDRPAGFEFDVHCKAQMYTVRMSYIPPWRPRMRRKHTPCERGDVCGWLGLTLHSRLSTHSN